MSSIRKSLFFNQSNRLDRLCALTDGVYAIVLTLLVLELKIPHTPGLSEAKIIDELVRQIQNFFSYTSPCSSRVCVRLSRWGVC